MICNATRLSSLFDEGFLDRFWVHLGLGILGQLRCGLNDPFLPELCLLRGDGRHLGGRVVWNGASQGRGIVRDGMSDTLAGCNGNYELVRFARVKVVYGVVEGESGDWSW